MKFFIKNKKIIKAIFVFLGVFLLSFCLIHLLGFINNYGDPVNSYGFAKAIKMGQIPYLDFNTISTPLLAMYQSLFLHIYDDFIMINVSQAILVAMSFLLLYGMFGKKSFILILVTVLLGCKNLVATYNFMSFFFLVLLLFMEKKYNDKDILIGIILALGVLAKQTVGIFAIIPSIVFYRKNLKKLGRRFIGFLIPCFIFLVYLLWNKALYEFFDLCLFGLFDFGSKNGVGGGHIYTGWLLISLLFVLVTMILLFKNKKDIHIYYFCLGFLYAFPLFDITHFSFWAMCFTIIVLPYIKISENVITTLVLAVVIPYSLLYGALWYSTWELSVTKKITNFKYNIQRTNIYENVLTINDFVNSYENPVVLGYFSMTHTIMNDKKLSYFDILYDGNYGYNGSKKMINKINEMHDQIFIISVGDYESKDEFSQISKDIMEYVMKTCKKVDSKYGMDVYYKE